MNKKLVSEAGFAPVKRAPKRLVMSIQGPVKSGKTRLALTAPKPIGYIAIDIGGDEGPVDEFIPKDQEFSEDIQQVPIRMDPINYPDRTQYGYDKDGTRQFEDATSAAVQAAAEPAMSRFYVAYYASLANFRTTVIDTGTDFYELMRKASFGRLERVPQLAYTQLYGEYHKLIDDAFDTPGHNLIITHHLKEKREMVMNEKTGKKESQLSGIFDMAGFKEVKERVLVVFETWREDLAEPCDVTGLNVKFNGQIVDSRCSAASMGKTFAYNYDFADVAMVLLGGKRSDWV